MKRKHRTFLALSVSLCVCAFVVAILLWPPTPETSPATVPSVDEQPGSNAGDRPRNEANVVVPHATPVNPSPPDSFSHEPAARPTSPELPSESSCCPDSPRISDNIHPDLPYNTLPGLLRAFGFPDDLTLYPEDEELIWDIVTRYRHSLEQLDEKRMQTLNDIADKKLAAGEYYDTETWERIRWKSPMDTATVFGRTTANGHKVVVPVLGNDDPRRAKIGRTRSKLRRDSIAEIRAILRSYTDPRESPREGSRYVGAPWSAPEATLSRALRSLAPSEQVTLTVPQKKLMEESLAQYRQVVLELSLERQALLRALAEEKASAGEYYTSEQLEKGRLDPRVVQSTDQIVPAQVDGKLVYVSLTDRNSPPLAELSALRREAFHTLINDLETTFQGNEDGTSVGEQP